MDLESTWKSAHTALIDFVNPIQKNGNFGCGMSVRMLTGTGMAGAVYLTTSELNGKTLLGNLSAKYVWRISLYEQQ